MTDKPELTREQACEEAGYASAAGTKHDAIFSKQLSPDAHPLSGGVGEGWKLVPVEPTKKMLEAGNACDGPAGMKYRAMLATAPASPEGRGDGWISVEERLPDETKPHEGYVLVWADGAVDCLAFYKGRFINWTNPESPNVHPENITHWQSITAPAGAKEGA